MAARTASSSTSQAAVAVGRSQPESYCRESLQRLVVQLSRPPRSFLLGGGEPLAMLFCRGRLSCRDCRRGARSERFQEPLVLSGEVRPAGETVQSDKYTQGLSAEDERHDQTIFGVKPDRAQSVVAEAGLVEPIAQALRAARAQRSVRHRTVERHLPADETVGRLSSSSDHLQSAICVQLDDQRAGRDQSSSTLGHELQDQVKIGFAADRARDLDHHAERINGLFELVAARF